MKRTFVASILLSTACGGGYSLTQPDPISPNQQFILSEVNRFEPMLNMGEFIALFGKPPAATYAAWANCQPGKGNPPYVINFNDQWIETVRDNFTLTATVAHEMCHHWVNANGGACWDEKAAENCAANLYGR